MKDLDFIENDQRIQIGKEKSKLFCEQLRRDTELLRKLKIMDYSLLLGIHYGNRREQDTMSPAAPTDLEDPSTAPTFSGTLNKSKESALNGSTLKKQHSNLSDKGNADSATTNQHPLSDENLKAHNAQIETLESKQLNPTTQVIDLQIKTPDQLAAASGSPSKNIEPPQSTTLQSKSPSFSLQPDGQNRRNSAPRSPIVVEQHGVDDEDEKKGDGMLDKPSAIAVARSFPGLSPTTPESNKPGHVVTLSTSEKPKLGPPGFSRVPSRRISQITSNVHHSRYAVKTPIELNFDMPGTHICI